MVPGGFDAQGVFHAALDGDSRDQVSLSNRGLVSVNLEGLPETLTSLSLAANSLSFVDLRPLVLCRNLTALILNGNKLADLDLSPLANTSRLERLWIHNNALTQLDLSPLSSCTSLRSFYLDSNKLDKVPLDLGPLATCGKHLRALRLGRNRLAGELDITPVLQCSALSTLDTCASVKLTAKTSGAVPAPLPPALRRRAATVHWVSVDDEGTPDTTADQFAPGYSGRSHAQILGGAHGSTHEKLIQGQAFPHVPANISIPAALPSQLLHASDRSSCFEPLEDKVMSLPESESLEELAALCATPLPLGFHAAVMVGFRRSCRFAAEALLQDHARLSTAFVSSPLASSADSLISRGALRACSVFLVRPFALGLISALRARDPDLPIVVVGAESENDGKFASRGATTFLSEPLVPRDALIIRSLACQRAKSMKMSNSHALSCLESVAPSTFIESGQAHDSRILSARSPGSRSSAQNGSTALTTMLPSPGRMESTLQLRLRTSGHSMPVRRRGPPRPPTIDFSKMRERASGITNGRGNRVEESAIGMLFSRCGGCAYPSDFSSIATLCGLPACASGSLHAASNAWSKMNLADKPSSPALSPVSIMSFSDASPSSSSPGGRDLEKFMGSHSRSTSASRCSVAELMEQNEDHKCQSNGVTYESFRAFWESQLRRRDPETRLFNVLRIAHNTEGVVHVSAIVDLAGALVANRPSDMASDDLRQLAGSVLCYEIKGAKWEWVRRQDLNRVKLCGALLAAENGMYNGVAAHLRSDRMSDIRMAFAAASGKRTHGSHSLTVKDVTWLNAERGLLTESAVKALFSRCIPESGMDLGHFAPLWLAVSDPCTRPAFEYLFEILDVDADGYLSEVDVAHFYIAKRNALLENGFIPTGFRNVWESLVDSVKAGMSRVDSAARVSMSDIRKLSSGDASQFFQSMLFIDDELSLVDIRKTSSAGSTAAMAAVAQF